MCSIVLQFNEMELECGAIKVGGEKANVGC